jgi:hypothetical protein
LTSAPLISISGKDYFGNFFSPLRKEMSELSSDSSDSECEREEVAVSPKGLTLNEVNDMVRDYEKYEKREERKKRIDAGIPRNEIVLTPEDVSKITLTKKQIKALKPPSTRTPKQMESAAALAERKKAEAAARREEKRKQLEAEKSVVDIRSDKSKPGVRVKIDKQPQKAKKKIAPIPEEEDSEEEPAPRSFQAKKPALDLEDEVEEKVNKLNKLNNVLSSNPFYAQVMASRGIRF